MPLSKIRFYSLLAAVCLLALASGVSAQDGPRASLMATVSQRIGTDTDITVTYSRPGVKGRVVWSELVPHGMSEGNNYSDGKPFPWRAGANENTTFESTSDLMVEGQRLPAGKYGVHMIPSETTWIIAFSRTNDAWGSYSYNEADDALRVTVRPVAAPHQEWLLWGFGDLAGTSATAYLHWEELMVPFRVELANR